MNVHIASDAELSAVIKTHGPDRNAALREAGLRVANELRRMAAVDAAIASSNRHGHKIGAQEARAIRRILAGRH